ncbi:MAG: acyl-CoA thioesterase [Pseudomonadota bacterium]|nr:acyl-CoA thioesterase [Pseudomonadota bacterium]
MSVDIKVRGYHLDIYHHVNNGRYLEFLEEGRWDYFERYRFFDLFESKDLAFVVANINISYRRPAYAGETIRVITRMDTIGNKSAKAVQEVRLLQDGQPADLIADAVVTFCLMDAVSQKSVAIAGELRATLEKMIEDGV